MPNKSFPWNAFWGLLVFYTLSRAMVHLILVCLMNHTELGKAPHVACFLESFINVLLAFSSFSIYAKKYRPASHTLFTLEVLSVALILLLGVLPGLFLGWLGTWALYFLKLIAYDPLHEIRLPTWQAGLSGVIGGLLWTCLDRFFRWLHRLT